MIKYSSTRWTALIFFIGLATSAANAESVVVDDFNRPKTLYHGNLWETLNPGYWEVKQGALRRRLQNVGNGNPSTSFPFHWSNGGKPIAARTGNRTPNLPMGMIWRRDWKLQGNYTLRATFTIHDVEVPGRGEPTGFLGLCFGGETFYESRDWKAEPGARSWMVLWDKHGKFGLFDHVGNGQPLDGSATVATPPIAPGDRRTIELSVSGADPKVATVAAALTRGQEVFRVSKEGVDRAKFTDGLFGLTCYGALDFEVNRVEIQPGVNQPLDVRLNPLHVCYPLGDTLQEIDGQWVCKFVALFRSDGKEVEIRVSNQETPPGGWAAVPVAGRAKIVDNAWRRYTAVMNVTLPINPAEQTLYYTVWKDGVDVTPDPRPADPTKGYLGPKKYVGRLPRLTAPYRICTLGGHALLHGGTTLPRNKTFEENWIHGQPTKDAFRYFEDYNFQIVNWDDDVWYLELMFPPPSTDDAYKVITLTIANPTTRWQMMRHWNIINPGDHDYGMDDVKGPEQLMVRKYDDLGQDSEYMRRNFSINHHLIEGRETPITTENPQDWRRWKMPNGDFSILVLESRLWRTSQDTSLWRDRGWDKPGGFDRTDPTRTLLGEQQFAWLQEILHTDSSPLILISGINCMHTVFGGILKDPKTGFLFDQDDRVAADYAGWCKAGTDRLLELLGSRSGILSVYGDIHMAGVVEDKHQRVIESSCGPIGRGGSRPLKEDWAPDMQDYDGRNVKIHALYDAYHQSPDRQRRVGPPHWNFLETVFDTQKKDPVMTLKIRNIIDPPSAEYRGGGFVERAASSTGRLPSCGLADIQTLPQADVSFTYLDGRPIRGIRSLNNGRIPICALVDVPPGTKLLMTSNSGKQAEAQIVTTIPLK